MTHIGADSKKGPDPEGSGQPWGILAGILGTGTLFFIQGLFRDAFESAGKKLSETVAERLIAPLAACLPLLPAVLLIALGLRLSWARVTSRVGDLSSTRHRFSKTWRRIGGITAGLGVILGVVTIYQASDEFLEAAQAWRSGHSVVVTASRAEMLLEDRRNVDLSVSLDGAACPKGSLFDLVIDGEKSGLMSCDQPIPFRLPSASRPKPGSACAVKVEGTLYRRKPTPSEPGLLERLGSARPIYVRVTHRVFEVKILPARPHAYQGGRLELEVSVNGGADTSAYRYSWRASEGSIESLPSGAAGNARFVYQAGVEFEEGSNSKSVELLLRVIDGSGTQVDEPHTVKVVVESVPRVYTMYVLDASERTSRPGPTHRPVLSDAKESLAQELKIMGDHEGHVGIQVFGTPRVTTDPCRNTRSLIELGPLELDAALEKLDRIMPGQPEAPLLFAYQEALQRLKKLDARADSRIHIVTITAGTDTCVTSNAGQLLEKIRASYEERAELKGWRTDYRLLELTVGIAFKKAAERDWNYLRNGIEYQEFDHVILVAEAPATLRAILRGTTLLGSNRMADRYRGYDELIRIATQQGDLKGANRLKLYRDASPRD